jgi:hypothetical protein
MNDFLKRIMDMINEGNAPLYSIQENGTEVALLDVKNKTQFFGVCSIAELLDELGLKEAPEDLDRDDYKFE